jgi:hypothetical protein
MGLFERHLILVKLSFAETDQTFPTESRHRAEGILAEIKATYHVQVFSGVVHGFATRGDPTIEHIRAPPFSFDFSRNLIRMSIQAGQKKSLLGVLSTGSCASAPKLPSLVSIQDVLDVVNVIPIFPVISLSCRVVDR